MNSVYFGQFLSKDYKLRESYTKFMTTSGTLKRQLSKVNLYDLDTRPTSLFYLFVRVNADPCTMKCLSCLVVIWKY